MKIVVTGGCGYVGSVLVPKLLRTGHEVTVLDLQWFGNYLPPHSALTVVKADIRTCGLPQCDAVIHLAAVANDPCGELDSRLTWEVNALATARLADMAAKQGARFIYASSGSVYGVSDAPRVTEETPLVPLSDYNKTKLVAERCVMSYADRMTVQIVRPATVCGFSPRMRLDVVVNMLTMQAMDKGRITVLGGGQMRPHLHIEDMADLYCWLLEHPEITGVFNANACNMTVLALAEIVTLYAKVKIDLKESNDPRSYRMDSAKLKAAGFFPKHAVTDAISELCERYELGQLEDRREWYNLKAMPC